MGFFNLVKLLFGPSKMDYLDDLDVREARSRLGQSRSIQLIDVRTLGEHEQGFIKGARLIPLHELEKRLREIDRIKPVIIYCRSGHRSGMALRLLKEKGFAEAAHISGGIMAWTNSGLPVERK